MLKKLKARGLVNLVICYEVSQCSKFKFNILKGLSDGLLFFVKRQKVFNQLTFEFCYEHDLFPNSGYNTNTKRYKNYNKSGFLLIMYNQPIKKIQ